MLTCRDSSWTDSAERQKSAISAAPDIGAAVPSPQRRAYLTLRKLFSTKRRRRREKESNTLYPGRGSADSAPFAPYATNQHLLVVVISEREQRVAHLHASHAMFWRRGGGSVFASSCMWFCIDGVGRPLFVVLLLLLEVLLLLLRLPAGEEDGGWSSTRCNELSFADPTALEAPPSPCAYACGCGLAMGARATTTTSRAGFDIPGRRGQTETHLGAQRRTAWTTTMTTTRG